MTNKNRQDAAQVHYHIVYESYKPERYLNYTH
jgi:hypothetical protein